MIHESNHYKILFDWLEIREASGYDFPNSTDQLNLSMNKSALLERMLSGKSPLPIPPPTKFSYPWYSLIDSGEGTSTDVWLPDGWAAKLHDYPALYINQFAWKIVQTLGDNDWIVTYSYEYHKAAKFAEDNWHVYKVDNYWKIKKLPT
jgi:hypothetical protein